MTILRAPSVLLSWAATSLTTSFEKYVVYMRPSRAAAAAWQKVAEITVPPGYTAATVEAQHTGLIVYNAGWAATGAQWADGWDFAVSAYDGVLDVETQKSTIDARNIVAGDTDPWITCNAAPYLNTPIPWSSTAPSKDGASARVFDTIAGRDGAIIRTRRELPGRRFQITFDEYEMVGEDKLRSLRAAGASGLQLALHLPLGDRVLGTLTGIGANHSGDLVQAESFEFIESNRTVDVCDYNLPAGIITNGSSQRVTHPDAGNLLDPASGAFSLVQMAKFSQGASTWAIAKRGGASADGYGFWRDGSNQFQFVVDGASAAGGPVHAIANWNDAQHVAIGTSSGTAQKLYRDGATTPVATSAVTHGAISTADVLSIGARSDGATWGAIDVVAWAYYPRELTAAEAQAASYYLLGYPGYRMPAGAVLFVDLRDERCWNGVTTTLTDLAGNGLIGTVVAAPPTRGIPWDLASLERF